ncbi:MAG: sulfite exporter TauE/SafE family protein [Oscillospiraceae bacterium]|nr:sulfite exporter TauE/SafE family protein [Oscillospiraceae bacterium]
MNDMNIIIDALAGFLTGVAASMGLGGGFVLIIYLTVFAGAGQMQAGGINLLFFLPIALVSMFIHTKNKLIEWRLIAPICIAGAFGVVAGAVLTGVVGDGGLRKMFAGLLVFVGVRELFHKEIPKTS